jgi:hypothetical protein
VTRAHVAIAVAAMAALLVGGCDTLGASASPTPAPGESSGIQPPTGSDGPLASLGPPPSPTHDDTTGVVLDPSVLDVLPTTVDSVPVHEDSDEASSLLNTTDLGRYAEAADAGVAVDGSNLVVAWVVRLRPAAFDATAYQQWRDSYDEGACSAAGGVKGRAQAELGGRTTYITSCVAALLTYHVWLEEQNMLVSASSVGESRLGERLMSTLRVPA